ncbi:MAG: WYL domain-containing protein [Chloroflexota bacterium]
MRADRLLSLLMLLQARGRLTAAELAHELGVSMRTVYRDLDALSAASVPVYTERGPGGGCALLEPYRTTLTGLSADEARVLFMLSVPEPLVELGVSGELKAAFRKLEAALPAARRGDETRIRQRIHLDPSGWSATAKPAHHLQTLYRAVRQDLVVWVTHWLAFDVRAEWHVQPYGLVAKAGVWYLVGRREGHMRVLNVGRIIAAELGDEQFERLPDFDLVTFWEAWCSNAAARRPDYPVLLRVAVEHLDWLSAQVGESISHEIRAGDPDDPGHVTLTLHFGMMEDARRRVLGLGAAVEVLAPRELRATVADYAAQVAKLYAR